MKQKTKINQNSGLSLVEALITLFIIGLILVLYQVSVGKVRLIQYARHEETALRVASNKIEELRSGGYAALPDSGNFSDTQLNSLKDSSATMTFTGFNADTEQVLITIAWRDSGNFVLRNLTLTTLITKTGGL